MAISLSGNKVNVYVSLDNTKTLEYSMTDTLGVLRVRNNGVSLVAGDTFCIKSGTSFSDVTTALNGGTPQSLSLQDVVQITGSPGNYSLIYLYNRNDAYYFVIEEATSLMIPHTGFPSSPFTPKSGIKFILPNNINEYENLVFYDNGSLSSDNTNLYVCVSDSNPSLLESDSVDFQTRTGVNDIPILVNKVTTYIPLAQFSNAVAKKEVIFRATVKYVNNGVSSYTLDQIKKMFTYYTGDVTRNKWFHPTWFFPNQWANDNPPNVVEPLNIDSLGMDGICRFIVDYDTGEFALEDWNDGNYTDWYGALTDPPLDVELPGKLDFYVNLSLSGNVGSGSISDPFSFLAFYNHTSTMSDGDDYTYHVKGYVKLDNNTNPPRFMHSIANNTLASGCTVTFRGWDISTHGSPIVEFNNTYGWSHIVETLYDKINITFKDFIFINNSDAILTIVYGTYKNVFFSSNKGISCNYGAMPFTPNPVWNYSFYGCTFQCGRLKDVGNNPWTIMIDHPPDSPIVGTITSYDTVYILDSFGPPVRFKCNTIAFENNISNVQGSTFQTSIHSQNINDYVNPIYNDSIQAIPSYPNAQQNLLDHYTSSSRMAYYNYNIPPSDGPSVQSRRTTYDYDNGLFNYSRTSFGAYSFLPPDEDTTYPTSGHIGAFYFGGDYSNANVSTSLSLTISPVDINLVDISTELKTNASIELNIPDIDFAEAFSNFYVDFVGKEQSVENYPNFCKCSDSKCYDYNISENIRYELISKYNRQVAGGNPLVVDFSACAHSGLEYQDYNPIEYKWWFDYENFPNEYVTCAGPYAQHTYCGGYLEEYDVRLCVTFQ